MRKITTILFFVLTVCTSIFAQGLKKPLHLGDWIAGEDPSEFLLHRVMERTERLLEENPNGRLIVRICSPFEFYGSFVRTTINPLAASNYNQYRLIVPSEKIFIALSPNCRRGSVGSNDSPVFVYNEYWFVPENAEFQYKEIYSVSDIDYRLFESSREFLAFMKTNQSAVGLVVYSSNNTELRNRVSEMEHKLLKIGTDRFKSVRKPVYKIGSDGKLMESEDYHQKHPKLITLEIKKKKNDK